MIYIYESSRSPHVYRSIFALFTFPFDLLPFVYYTAPACRLFSRSFCRAVRLHSPCGRYSFVVGVRFLWLLHSIIHLRFHVYTCDFTFGYDSPHYHHWFPRLPTVSRRTRYRFPGVRFYTLHIRCYVFVHLDTFHVDWSVDRYHTTLRYIRTHHLFPFVPLPCRSPPHTTHLLHISTHYTHCHHLCRFVDSDFTLNSRWRLRHLFVVRY